MILVVDDEEAVRALVVRGIRRSGFDVVEAATGEQALSIVAERDVDLIVLDVNMPGMSGTDVVRALREQPRTATLPILLMTGSGGHETLVSGLGAGADDFLAKPVRIDELVARVQAHLRSRAAWSSVVEAELRDRSAVVEALGHLTLSSEPEEAAETVVAEIARRSQCDFVAVTQLVGGDRMLELATFDRIGGVRRGGSLLGPGLSRKLLAQATAGPWVEDIQTEVQNARTPAFSAAGLEVGVGAPIYAGPRLVGLLSLGAGREAGQSSPARKAALLAAAIDYASMLSAVIGPAMADRRGMDETRARLRRLLSDGAFHPVYQPIVELETSAVVGFEALTRFDDGVAPDRRMAEAAGIGLGFEFELAAIEAALQGSSGLPGDAFLSLNMSPALVLQRGPLLRALLGSTTRRIVLELTEHVPIDDYAALRSGLTRLGGYDVAVDDAGAGYASFRHILELRPAFAKLDISLVRDIGDDDLRQALAAGLVYFALRSGCDLIAEGIESASDAAMLRRLGVVFGQGYLYGRPERA